MTKALDKATIKGKNGDSLYEGKTLLIVNTGSIKKRFILQRIKKLGIKIVVLNKEIVGWAQNYVDQWILANTFNHDESIRSVESFLLENKDIKFDGIMTFWETDVLLNSKLCDKYRVIGVPYSVAKKARNKFLFRQYCQENNLPVPKFKLINSFKDLKFIEKNFHFPVVLKPTYGSSSAYVIKADNFEELENTYNYIRTYVSIAIEDALSDGIEIIVEEYIDGNEVDMDILIQNGRIKFCAISDNAQTREPFFIETSRTTPSNLPDKTQNDLIKMADELLEKFGIQNGCLHFEAKASSKGPIPLEVNIRLGGDEIYPSVKEAYKVDLIEGAVKIALGVHINKIEKLDHPYKYLISHDFLSDYSGILVQFNIDPKLKNKKYVENIEFHKGIGDQVLVPPEAYENLGWILISGENMLSAQNNLTESIKYVKYEIAKFDQNSSLGKTSRKKTSLFSFLNKDFLLQRKKIEKIKKISIKNQRSLHVGIAYNSLDSINNDELVEKTLGKTLRDLGYSLSYFDFGNPHKAFNDLQKSDVDLVFNLCKYTNSSPLMEANITGMFDILQVPYTGSNQSTLSLCLDKIKIKKLLTFHGIPTPKWDYIYDINDEIRPDLKFPLIIKPSNTDNSVGITNESVVTNKNQLMKQLEKIIETIGGPVLIEEFIEGDEYDVSILGNDEDDVIILPPCRSIFDKLPQGYWHIYPYEAKYNQDITYEKSIKTQIPPKNISKKLYNLITEIALDTYNISDCQDYGSVEIRVDKNDNPFVLEINPNPEIAKDYFFALSAKTAGYNYDEFLEEIIHLAIKRYKNKPIFYNL